MTNMEALVDMLVHFDADNMTGRGWGSFSYNLFRICFRPVTLVVQTSVAKLFEEFFQMNRDLIALLF